MNEKHTVQYMKFIVLPLLFCLCYADIYWMNPNIKANASIVGWRHLDFEIKTLQCCFNN